MFAPIFEDTAAFLRNKGIEAIVNRNPPATLAELEQFRQETGLKLPDSFAAFHASFANGCEFGWQTGEDDIGVFVMPSLLALAEGRRQWAQNVKGFLDDPKSLDQCVKRPYRAQAFEIWRAMQDWLPFWREEDGDHFCLDLETGRIVCDQHDWFDGFGGLATTNGILAGTDLAEFLRSWSRFCFQPPLDCWWGRFANSGRICWEPQFFNAAFTQPA